MNNIKIGYRLIGGFVFIACLAGILGIFGFSGFNNAENSINNVSNIYLPSIKHLGDMIYNMSNVSIAQRTLLIKDITSTERNDLYSSIQASRKKYAEARSKYEPLPQTPDETIVWKEFLVFLDEAVKSNNAMFELIKKWEQTSDNGIYVAALNHYRDNNYKFTKLFETLEKIIEINEKNAIQNTGKVTTLIESNKLVFVVVLLLALIASLTLGVVLTRSITIPLSKIVSTSKEFSLGNFNTRLKIASKDELGTTATHLNTAFDAVVDKMLWYENILNAISFPVSVTDNNMKWTFLNKAVENIAKVKSSDMLGKHCNNWGANICNTNECGIRCAEKGNGQGRSYFTQPQFPGKEFLVDCSFIYNNKNEKVGHIEVIQDITAANDAKRQAEQALKDGIAQAAQQLEAVVEIVTSASEQLSAQIEQSTHGSEEQAQSISETATAMEEMNVTVLEVAKNASNAAGTADQAKVKAEEGAKMVGQVIQGIEQVQDQSQTMKTDMGNLGKQAEGIGQILNVISDIADQTNLLALNAAIEAARAGDAGRGFAVVADEVRKLAEKTMAATKEVGNAIRGIQDGTKKNIENVERTGKNIEEVTHLATNSGEALKQIVTLSDKTTDQVRSIATASEQQSATSEEINRSIESVNRISSETADAMRQSTQAVTELANQAQVLKRLIEEMKSDSGSGATALHAGKKPLALGRG